MTEETKAKKPKIQPSEMDKLEQQFEKFDEQVKDLTMDRMNQAPKLELEPQTKLSQSEIEKAPEIHLKPARSIGAPQKFNEKFREDLNFAKQEVRFIAENNEIKGEKIEMWTRPFGGMPAEFWQIPVNKPVWAPRYVAEQLKRKFYHRLVMEDKPTASEGGMTYYGSMVVDTTIQRLDAHPASNAKKSIFMGANNF